MSGVVGAIVRGRPGTVAVHRASPDPLTVYTYDGRGLRVKLAQSDGGPSQERSFLYDDQMHLVAETTYQAPPSTAIAYEYVWFNGQPVAQETILGSTAWTVTDHLGTPFAQASANGTVIWRVEYEPYGEVYSLRSGTDRHQPLRLPGQEAEQIDVGLNGDSERSYNIFRWYRPKWGRYTQADPIGLQGGTIWDLKKQFAYGDDRPTRLTDPLGLVSTVGCTTAQAAAIDKAASDAQTAVKHCLRCGDKPPSAFIRSIRDTRYFCLDQFSQGILGIPDYCAQEADDHNHNDGRSVTFYDRQWSDKDCGCLKGTLLHEVSHHLGYQDHAAPDAYELAHRCFSCAIAPY